MKKIAVFIGLVVLGIVGVVLFKTFSNTPGPHQKSNELTPLTKEAIAHMTESIQIKTETPNDAYEFDTATFFAYRKFLEKSYPLVHKNLPRTVIDSFNYIYEWKGTDTGILPMVLMAHYDVVPVEGSAVKLWHAAPYGGEVKEGYIWGRGVIDDKSSMIEILEAAEAQLAKGFQPKQTILLCFGADEESSGRGATAMVKYFKSRNQRFDIVVDEGGEISTEDMIEVKRPIASIGVGEKGYVTLILTVQIAGGHSSIPVKSTAIDILSKGLYQLRQNQMPAKLTPPIRAYLERVSSYTENFGKKMALSNLWLFEKQVLSSMADAPSSNAMVRTTIVPTIINSGVRDNVIPTYATAYVNSRILPGETQKDVYNFVEKAVNDTNIKITYYNNYSTMPSPTTDINSKAFKRVENAINAIVDDVIVAPMVMLGASDSRNYREVSDGVINFTPITNGKGYHGIDERMLVTDFQKGINFFSLLIQGSK